MGSDFAAVEQAIENYADTDFAVVIGTANGEVFSYTKGTLSLTEQTGIASASKWFTSATIYRLIEAGTMNLSDNPQDHLPFWTSDPADPRSRITLEQLLSFTSGFNARPGASGCTQNSTVTLQDCALEIFTEGLDSDPGAGYSYGPEHMHIAAAMAENAASRPFADVFRVEVADPLGMSGATQYVFPSRTNPLASGGAASTAQDYARFVQALLASELFNDSDRFFADRIATTPILFRPLAAQNFGDWHYALGAFVECDITPFAQSCNDDATYSSPGSFGWTPWIDRKNGYWGLIARRGERNSAPVAVELQQLLQPLIVEAISR